MNVVAVVKLELHLESRDSSRCIRPSRTNLKLTGPMLRDKNGRSYKRKAGQSKRQYVYFYVFGLY